MILNVICHWFRIGFYMILPTSIFYVLNWGFSSEPLVVSDNFEPFRW